MSKASEWAERYVGAKSSRPESYSTAPSDDDRRKVHARVTDEGKCGIQIAGHFPVLDVDVALALARWILDTFGDATPPTAGSDDSAGAARSPQDASGPPAVAPAPEPRNDESEATP